MIGGLLKRTILVQLYTHPQGGTVSLIESYIGKNVFVRTVTHHHTGHLAAADERWLLLEDAAWIADDGRFADALKSGSLAEVEPFPGACLVSAGSVIDLCEWQHELPRTQV